MSRPRRSRLAPALFGASVALYAASFLMPVVPDLGADGWYAFVMSFRIGVSGEDVGFLAAWLANPALWLALALAGLRRPRLARTFAALAVILATAYFPIVMGWEPVREFDVGYWAWVASMALALAAALCQRPAARRVPAGRGWDEPA